MMKAYQDKYGHKVRYDLPLDIEVLEAVNTIGTTEENTKSTD